MDNEQVLQLVDQLFHEFASSYRSEARQRAVEKLTAHNKQSTPSVPVSGRMSENSDGYDTEGYSCF